MPLRGMFALVSLVTATETPTAAAEKPNVFIMLTDDQDDLLESTSVQPNLLKRVGGEGVRFQHGFANHPVCCVSRSSLLTGRYSHNTKVVNNSDAGNANYPGNCTSPAWAAHMEPTALAVHLHGAGYRSLYLGKYMNNAHMQGSVPPAFDPFKYIPPGWSEWYGLQGNSKYYNYSISNNGTREDHGDDYEKDYLPLQLLKRAQKFLAEHAARNRDAGRAPFLLFMGTPSAHANFIPPPQYWNISSRGVAANATAPRTPNHNLVCEHCHLPLRHYTPMSSVAVAQSDDIWRRRLGCLAYVDDMLGTLFDQLEGMGELQRTFFLYTADNGFHLGQWAQGFDKRQLYETDVRVPYFVRCPGCVRGAVLPEPVSHIDIAPTVLDMAGVQVPSYMDGRSFAPMLRQGSSAAARQAWDPRVFIQYFGESYVGGSNPPDRDFQAGCGNGIGPENHAPGAPYPGHMLAPVAYDGSPCDGWNNTYTCTRKVSTPASPADYMYCAFDCFEPVTMRPMACDASQPEGTGEYYDMAADPWQMHNTVASLAPKEHQTLSAFVEAMRACEGAAAPEEGGCRLPPLAS